MVPWTSWAQPTSPEGKRTWVERERRKQAGERDRKRGREEGKEGWAFSYFLLVMYCGATNIHIQRFVLKVLYEAEHWRIDAFKLWCLRRFLTPLGCKEIKLVNPKVNQPWIFIGRTDAEAEAPILWPPDGKSWLIGKDCGEDGKQEEQGWQRMRWLDANHHQLSGCEFEQTLGDGEG